MFVLFIIISSRMYRVIDKQNNWIGLWPECVDTVWVKWKRPVIEG